MFEKPVFFGSTTVGERGQIVLPIDLRKKYQIKAGDKLIVVGLSEKKKSGAGRVMLFKAEVLNDIIAHMEQHQKAMKEMLKVTKGAKSKE